MKTIGLIGTGHMGSAIIRAVDRTDLELKILLSDARKEAAEALSETLVHPSSAEDNASVIEKADLVFLAVKPQNMEELMRSLHEPLLKNPNVTLVSMAVGTTIDSILSWAGTETGMIRIMPNTPIEVDRGAVAYAVKNADEEDVRLFFALLERSALLVPVPEEKLDAVSALSGSGPAFVYLMIHAMARGGEALGISSEEALELAAKTLSGAAEMVLRKKGDPTTLANAVCSPGGTTIEGVKTLEKESFESIVEAALQASYRRALELK